MRGDVNLALRTKDKYMPSDDHRSSAACVAGAVHLPAHRVSAVGPRSLGPPRRAARTLEAQVNERVRARQRQSAQVQERHDAQCVFRRAPQVEQDLQ